MNRLRTLAPLVVASFVAGTVVPQALVVEHDHDGGAVPHVHVDRLFAEHHHPHDDADHDHHHDHVDEVEAAAAADAQGAALEPASHRHWQQPFQRVHGTVPPCLVRSDRLTTPPPPAPSASSRPSPPVGRSRAPPAPSV
jgi:hypothetical protein